MANETTGTRRAPARAPSLSDSFWRKQIAPQWRKSRLENERMAKKNTPRKSE